MVGECFGWVLDRVSERPGETANGPTRTSEAVYEDHLRRAADAPLEQQFALAFAEPAPNAVGLADRQGM